jgi:hypothetical protein
VDEVKKAARTGPNRIFNRIQVLAVRAGNPRNNNGGYLRVIPAYS